MASDSFSTKLCNPFSGDIFPDGDPATASSLTLHHDAEERLEELLAEAAQQPPGAVRHGNGRVILLKAPRAGYGKSHLLSRLQIADPLAFFVVPLEFDPGETLSWKSLLDQVFQILHQPGNAGAPAPLDLVARRTFAMANAGMIRAGKIPCGEPETAAVSLEQRFAELFDFTNPEQEVARWFQENFERLLPVSSSLVSEETGLSKASALLWLRALCGYAQGGAGVDASRLSTLLWSLKQPDTAPGTPTSGGMRFLQATTEGDAFYKEKLGELCRLTAATRPLVVLLDHLDSFHGSSDKVLRLANFLSDWRRLSGRTRFVLSVNQDLWTQTFLKTLPSALEDRLTGSQITLGGISREAAEELIRLRLAAARVPEPVSHQFTNTLALPRYFAEEAGKLISPRAVLRYAAHAWQEYWKAPAAPAGDPTIPVAKMRDMLDRLRERLAPSLPDHSHKSDLTDGSGLSRLPDKTEPATPFLKPANFPPNGATPHNGSGNGSSSHSGAILPDPVPANPRTVPVASPFLTSRAVGPDHALQVRFHTLRAHFSSSPWLMLDQDRLYHLMKLSGQRLAVVRFLESGLPGLPGAIAGVWQSPDAEILFGSEPYEDRAYWAALIDFARQRASYVPGSRLVMFSAAAAPVNLGGWLHQDEIVAARARFLDLQTLDHLSLAACYAADEVLRESERGTLPLGAAEAFTAMAPHLEMLWKKLTRPLTAN